MNVSSWTHLYKNKQTPPKKKKFKKNKIKNWYLIVFQAELVKLTQFRRFLRSSNLSQLDFLLRVEQLRRSRDQEAGQEIDEEGKAYQNAR